MLQVTSDARGKHLARGAATGTGKGGEEGVGGSMTVYSTGQEFRDTKIPDDFRGNVVRLFNATSLLLRWPLKRACMTC